MSIPRLSVREYVQVSEDLLKTEDLTDGEMEVAQEMLVRLSEKFDSGYDRKP